MAKLTMKMDAVSNMRSVTMHVELRRVREARARMWLGYKLMYMAAWIMGCKVSIKAIYGGKHNG